MITRSKLLKSPAEYGRKYAFLVQRGLALNLKAKAVANAPKQIELFQQVQGGSRVCTASLSVKVRACTVAVAPYSALQDDDTTFPIYFLPWEMNRTIRVTLKPSKHQVLAREPDVFFTDNLNGCLVTVEGPPDRPTVYHSNVIDYLGSPGGNPAIEEELARLYIEAKAIVMEKGYKLMSAQHDKVGEARKGLLHPMSVNQHQYQVLVGRPSGEKAVVEAMDIIARDKKISYHDVSGHFACEASLGSVFGVRDGNGYWSFYYQRLVLVTFYRKEGPVDNPKFVYAHQDWRCLTCDMFWPFGSGTMVV
jgi:hypothetical protein